MDKETDKLGMEIVKKCVGLPLAIIVLGGILATKRSSTEWEKVNKNIDLYLRGKGSDQEYFVVHGVLALSYNELSYYLKSCFLHLGHFREDYDISCKTLFRLWAAEGFVSQCQNDETMEDVAERYLHNLIDRSIVKVSQLGSMGRVKTCRLHDLMRDFCLSKANQENYLKIVRTTNINEKPNSNRVHRLAIYQDDDRNDDLDLKYFAKTTYLRSFFLYWSHNIWKFTMINSSFRDFKMLKIMSLERCTIGKEMGREIGGLIHLRYLTFKDSGINYLPSSIGNLKYLQTLIIGTMHSRYFNIKVTNVLWKLEQLRHVLLGEDCKIKGGKRLRLGNMRKMQTLQLSRRIELFDVGELVNSTHLKKVVITLNEKLDEIPSVCLGTFISLSIKALTVSTSEEELERFLLTCQQLLKLDFLGKIVDKLPEWQHFPPGLIKLTLQDRLLKEDPTSILEKLPNLRILRLLINSFMGKLLVCSSKGFPQLRTLHLENLYRLEWKIDEEAMPNLSQLYIRWCYPLKMIPEGIKFITTLRQLKIETMPKEFEDRVRRHVDGREGADFYKIRHVPSIIIRDTLPTN